MTQYIRFAHLKEQSFLKQGHHIKKGDLIGYIGNTGHSTGTHLHWDCPNEYAGIERNPYVYVYGLTKEQVARRYTNPAKFREGNIPAENTLPYNGYRYLERAKTKWRTYYHSGEDANSLNDYGKPVYSPVDAVVYFVAPVSSWRNRHGHGWGNMLILKVEASQKRKVIKIDKKLTKRLEGKLLLQVENKGQLWYVHNGKKYFLGTTEKDYQHFVDLVRRGVIRALGISNDDINKIETGY